MRCLMLGCMLLSSVAMAQVDLVTVKKSERKMVLLAGDHIVKTYHVSFGGDPKGHKEQEGDQKTPEGLYILDYKKEDSIAYRSMHISYPNEQDIANAEAKGVAPGGFIMVHGQMNGWGWLSPINQRFNWTDGCIALTNAEMDEFMALVAEGTRIHITY